MKIVLSRTELGDRGFLLDGDELQEVLNIDRKASILEGTILIGRVRDVRPAIKGAFIRLMAEKEHAGEITYGFLPMDDVPFGMKLKPEMTLPVQVVSAPAGSKPYKLTAKPTIAGVYAVIKEGKGLVHISRKLSDEQRNQIKTYAAFVDSADFDVTYRTNAAALTEEQFKTNVLAEVNALMEVYRNVIKKAAHFSDYALLYSPPDPLFAKIRDLHPEEIVIDLPSGISRTYEEVLKKNIENTSAKIRFYEDASGTPYRRIFGIDKQLREMKDRKVYLRSGAYIIIDHAEALTAIDVNSGKKQIKVHGNMDKAALNEALNVNMEASREIFRQIRLRNLSGMILIDYINMDSSMRAVLELEIRRLCRMDPIPMKFVDFTGLGLAEITRKKTGEALDLY